MTVRTRFAPSPTGYLHIGGVRTALFNWLFARKHGGQFILRIDDTDAGRNIESALAPILHGFKWLGIDWDEGAEIGGPHAPYYQSQRLGRYQAAVKVLLDKGLAYHDYATPEELKTEREVAEKERRESAAKEKQDAVEKDKRTYHYSRRWMAETAADRARFEAEGRKASVRLKMPREGRCEYQDRIRGPMDPAWIEEQDHVIQRADGSCLYNLATVVDDFDMKITHVIRAEEHLSNTPRQIFIAQGLGYPLPEYAHLPFVAEPGSKRKLSKRELEKYLKNVDFRKIYEHGRCIAEKLGLEMKPETFNPVIVDFYEQVGYLPHAIVNYLLLLGWAYDDKKEWFTRQEMIDLFSLEKVNKAPASFDVKKLFAFQEHYMQELPIEEKVRRVLPFLEKTGVQSGQATELVSAIVRAAGDRIKVAGDILDYCDFFTPADQLKYDEKAFDKSIRNDANALPLLKRVAELLAKAEPFEAAALEKLLHDFLQAEGLKFNQLHAPLRVALTGKPVGFGLFDTLAILGKERSLKRIELAIGRVS